MNGWLVSLNSCRDSTKYVCVMYIVYGFSVQFASSGVHSTCVVESTMNREGN